MKTETRSFYEAAVAAAVVRITETLDAALDLALLARGAALSPFHFHRVFRGMVAETPLEMHRRLRLERAASRLLASETAVITIAFDAGYETHEAFTRAFRVAYGESPSAFREEAKAPGCAPRQLHLAARSGVHFNPSFVEQHIHFVKGEPIMNVIIEEMPGLRVATVRHVGPYNRISEAFARLGAIVDPLRLPPATTMMLAIYHDDPETTPAEQLQSDAGVTVPEGVALPAGVAETRIPAGPYARTTHIGPYTTLGDTWARFMGEWLPGSDHRVGAGPSFEVYRNNPSNTKPEELRTDLHLPIARDG